MAFKYSSGQPTVTGDLKAKEDAQRDTLIDFGEDQIDFHGEMVLSALHQHNGITWFATPSHLYRYDVTDVTISTL